MDRNADNRDQAETGRPEGEMASHPLDDQLGAYLLDALPEAELREFEAHLASSPDLRAEAALLAPVVRVLPSAMDEAVPDVAPPTALRDRILSAALAEAPAPVPIAELPHDRTPPTGTTTPTPIRTSPARGVNPWGLIAAAFALVAVGAVIWALNVQGQLDDRADEMIALENQATTAALRDNAVAWTFTPTEDGPTSATGNLFYSSREQRVALACEGLPDLPENQVYQLWYLTEGQDPQPAGTFQAGPDGRAAMIEPNITAGSFQQAAITAEPEGGSEAPTGDILLMGTLSAAG